MKENEIKNWSLFRFLDKNARMRLHTTKKVAPCVRIECVGEIDDTERFNTLDAMAKEFNATLHYANSTGRDAEFAMYGKQVQEFIKSNLTKFNRLLNCAKLAMYWESRTRKGAKFINDVKRLMSELNDNSPKTVMSENPDLIPLLKKAKIIGYTPKPKVVRQLTCKAQVNNKLRTNMEIGANPPVKRPVGRPRKHPVNEVTCKKVNDNKFIVEINLNK